MYFCVEQTAASLKHKVKQKVYSIWIVEIYCSYQISDVLFVSMLNKRMFSQTLSEAENHLI